MTFASGMAAASAISGAGEADRISSPRAVMYWGSGPGSEDRPLRPQHQPCRDLRPRRGARRPCGQAKPGCSGSRRRATRCGRSPTSPRCRKSPMTRTRYSASIRPSPRRCSRGRSRKGADIVIHSATKYLNGHSDVVAGALAAARGGELWEHSARYGHRTVPCPSPFEAWLLMRGMRTLDVRVREQAHTAALLASRLSDHPSLSALLYPGPRQPSRA